MRKAAGILMIALGITTMAVFAYGIQPHYSLTLNLLMAFSTVFVIVGGVFCLKRKFWVLCLVSSVVLCWFSIWLWWAFLPYALGIFLAIPGGFISLVFVCLRKGEWHELSA